MSNGLGDRIEKVFEKTGIKRAVETVADIMDADCGCAERRERLNAIGKKFGIGESGAVEVIDAETEDHVDSTHPEARRARNAAKKAAWEEEHGRPYGTPDPG